MLIPRHWMWEEPVPLGLADSLPPQQPVVWLAALVREEQLLAPLAATLSADEQVRRSKFRRLDDRHRFVIGRGLVRTIGSALTGLAADQLAIALGAHGKPFFAGLPAARWHFNVAHAGEWIAVAFGLRHELGVDLEVQRDVPEADAIMAKIVPPQELHRWRRLETGERHAAFFRAWTRHEAEAKALGTGLGGEEIPVAQSLQSHELALPTGYVGWVAESKPAGFGAVA